MSTTHKLAVEYMKIAQFLTTKPDVEIPVTNNELIIYFWGKKEEFVSVVKEMGAGKKEIKDGYFNFRPSGTNICFRIPRDKTCKKIQEEKWECESMFDAEEFVL